MGKKKKKERKGKKFKKKGKKHTEHWQWGGKWTKILLILRSTEKLKITVLKTIKRL